MIRENRVILPDEGNPGSCMHRLVRHGRHADLPEAGANRRIVRHCTEEMPAARRSVPCDAPRHVLRESCAEPHASFGCMAYECRYPCSGMPRTESGLLREERMQAGIDAER